MAQRTTEKKTILYLFLGEVSELLKETLLLLGNKVNCRQKAVEFL